MLSKFNNRVSAVERFTNREKPIQVFTKGVLDYNKSPNNFLRVLVYYGVGGIGKTTLLKKLRKIYKENESFQRKKHKIVKVNLRAVEIKTPVSILLVIRNQLGVNCDLFDFAILKYWKLVGLDDKKIKNKLHLFTESSFLWEVIDGLSPITTQPFRTLLKHITKKHKKRFGKYQDELSIIDNFEVEELQQRLPYYLGRSINDSQKKYQYFFFIDSFETLTTGNSVDILYNDEWLYEFIASSMSGLYIIGSREYIKWTERNSEWEKYLDQHILGSLSNEDSRYYLEGVPIMEESIKESIIKSSNGLPFYLELCTNIYLHSKQSNIPISPITFDLSKTEILERFLNHIEPNLIELFKLLSLFDDFEEGLIKFLIKNYSIGLPTTLFGKVLDYSIVEVLNSDKHLYRIHSDVKNYIKKSVPENQKYSVYYNFLSSVNNGRNNLPTTLVLKYFLQISRGLNEIDCEEEFIENYISVGLTIISEGYWVEIHEVYKHEFSKDRSRKSKRISNMLASKYFLYSISVRRVGSVKEALKVIRIIDKKTRNKFSKRIRLQIIFQETNYLRILGKYNKALKNYSFLVKKGRNILSQNDFSKMNRQYADILFLKGDFKKALRKIKFIFKNLPENSLEAMESYRILGHIYRFNLNFKKAIDVYDYLKEVSLNKKWVGLLGKTYTNLTESFCWIEPHSSIKYGKLSVEINGNLESNIELGKTYSALVIAYVLIGDFKKAKKVYEKSIKLHSKSGYKSGILFAEVSKYFIFSFQKREKKCQKQLKFIKSLMIKLKVYDFLLLPIYIIRDEEQKNEMLKDINWLNLDQSTMKFIKILKK